MNILYSGDANIAYGVTISALSLCHNVKEPLNIYILTADIKHGSTSHMALPLEFGTFLEEQIRKYNLNHTVTLIDITEKFAKDKPLANMETRFTPCCMLRLYADLVPELPDKILYLDNDVICRLNPAEFYNKDINNFSLAGSLDYYGSWFFRNRPLARDYLNSGVLLLNLKRIRENGLFAKCRLRCKTEEMFMPDQSAINKLCLDKKICPRRFNEQRKLKKNTVFQHFTTSFRFFPVFHAVSVKPWNIEGMHKRLRLYAYDEILSEYQYIKQYIKEILDK